MTLNLIGVDELSAQLDVPISWIYGKTRTGEIPHFKVGKYVKFDPNAVMEWLKQQTESIGRGGQ